MYPLRCLCIPPGVRVPQVEYHCSIDFSHISCNGLYCVQECKWNHLTCYIVLLLQVVTYMWCAVAKCNHQYLISVPYVLSLLWRRRGVRPKL
jgi:hypothetical protein